MGDKRMLSPSFEECAHDRRLQEAVDELERHRGIHVKPDVVPTLLRQCGNAKALAEGKRVHAYIIKTGYDRDRFLGNLLVEMYGKCGSIEAAKSVFQNISSPNVFSWTILISAYAQNGHYKEALKLFQRMDLEGVKPDKITFVGLLDACASLLALEHGKKIHSRIVDGGFDSDVILGTALLNMYGKCGDVSDARKVFDKMQRRDVVAWNAMIAAYAQNGYSIAAFKLFKRMRLERVQPNRSTFVSMIDACASMAGLTKGKEIHEQVTQAGFMSDAVIRCALANMYGKCGNLDEARSIFDRFAQRDVVSWNSMIAAYAQNGHGKDALELFGKMERASIKPNGITFIHVLSACSHSRLLEDGRRHFDSMARYGIEPSAQHYRCMIDLLGRAGHLDEAEELLRNMPFKPDTLAWTTLLGACRIHKDVQRGERCAGRVFELEPKYSAPYVLLSNIYAAAGKWDDVARVRKMMEYRHVRKPSGRSSIEVDDKIHVFIAGDKIHPQRDEIYGELKRLSMLIKDLGYVPDTNLVLHDVEEEEKEQMLSYHSEKLAIAFGNMATPPGTPLYIIKNLRVCPDCHVATKFISRIVGREIILRDPHRFHHVSNGICSCGEFW